MDKDSAVKHYKSAYRLAKALGITSSAVTQWETIPRLRQFQIEAQTNGALKADRSPIRRVLGPRKMKPQEPLQAILAPVVQPEPPNAATPPKPAPASIPDPIAEAKALAASVIEATTAPRTKPATAKPPQPQPPAAPTKPGASRLAMMQAGPTQAAPTWWKTDAGIEAKGRELGIPAQRGESYASYRDRIAAVLQSRQT